MTWLGCTRQCKKNWKQHPIQNKSKFLPWYLINGLNCTVENILMSMNTLFELHMKSKKQVEYQQNLFLKKGKTIPTEKPHLVTNQDDNLKMRISVGKCLKCKVVNRYINKNFATCKSLCNLQKLYTAFKRNTQM